MNRPLSAQQTTKPLWTTTANDRMKARWRGLVARSTLIAAVLHVALVALWPTWDRTAPSPDPLQEFLQLEWVSVLEARSQPQPDPAPAIQLGSLPDSLPQDTDVLANVSGTGTTIATLTEAFRERLAGRSAPRPTVTELDLEGEVAAAASSGEGENTSIDVDRSVAAAEFAELLGADPLDLDRLSAVRPELVLVAPSAWVLLRNPSEVEQFIVGSYRRGELDRSANGSVSVALWIDARGRVEWAEISQSSGRPDMDQVALELFSEVAAFRPARDEGVAVPRSVIFSVRFPWY